METKLFTRLLIAGLALFSHQAFAQLPAIDSVKLIPANPTSNDVLKVVYFVTFPSGGCHLNTAAVDQIGNVIHVGLDYTVGMATYICHSIDTVEINNPGAGTFELSTILGINEQNMIEDSDTMEIHIDPFLEINELLSNHVTIYPNPIQNELHLVANFSVEKLEIYSLSGQRILSTNLLSENPKINVSNLDQGIYFVTLTDFKGNIFTQRISKNMH